MTKKRNADDFIREKLSGIVHTQGRGNVKQYVSDTIGIPYRTYLERMEKPSEFRMGTLKRVFDTCGFSDNDILIVFGRGKA